MLNQKGGVKLLQYLLMGIFFFPLVISDSFLFPFVTTKAFFFYLFVDALLLVYLFQIKKTSYYPRKSFLLFSYIGLHFLWLLTDFLIGINFFYSFWGTYERMVGLFTSGHLLVFLWILLSVCPEEKKFTPLLWMSIVVSFFVCVYGLLQKAGVSFPGVLQVADPRISSTLGNAAFLASFNLFHIFYCAYIFPSIKIVWQKMFLILAFVLNIISLYYTATRGAFVALVFSVLLMGVVVFFRVKKKNVRIALSIIFFCIFLAISGLLFFRGSSIVRSSTMLSRLVSISASDGTTNSRLTLWRIAYSAAKERPFFGYGTNNMHIPLDRYFDSTLAEDWFDSAHNIFVDMALAQGFFGLGVYIVFYIFLFWKIFLLQKRDLYTGVIFLGLFTAYIVQGFFIFDSFVSAIFFTFSLGLLIVHTQKEDVIRLPKIKNFVFVICFIFCVFILPVIYLRGIIPAKKVVDAHKLVNIDTEKSLLYYEEAAEIMFFGADTVVSGVTEIAVRIFAQPDRYTKEELEGFDNILSIFYEKALRNAGNYSKLYINFAKVSQRMYRVFGSEKINSSFALVKKAKEYSPRRLDVLYVEAQGYYVLGEWEKTLVILEQALKDFPEFLEIYTRLADVHVRKSSEMVFLDMLGVMKQKGVSLSRTKLEEYAKILISRGQLNAALEVFLLIDIEDPENEDVYYNIALIYKKIGQKEKAKIWAEKIINHNPGAFAEMSTFILEL